MVVDIVKRDRRAIVTSLCGGGLQSERGGSLLRYKYTWEAAH